MDNLLAVEGKAATTDEAMKKVYEEAAKQIASEQEVHAKHILVETEAEAKEIEAELKKGADFAELAKKKSKDPGASDGGDLGFFTKEQMVPEFSAAAFTLEPGKISEPVKSQFGWHIIKVEEKRNRKPPSFDQVKAQIETYVTRKAQSDYVAKLRQSAKVERMDKPAAKPDEAKPADAGEARRRRNGAGEKVSFGHQSGRVPLRGAAFAGRAARRRRPSRRHWPVSRADHGFGSFAFSAYSASSASRGDNSSGWIAASASMSCSASLGGDGSAGARAVTANSGRSSASARAGWPRSCASSLASTAFARAITAGRQPGQLRHLDAVGAVGRARQHLVQEHDVAAAIP